MLVSQFCHCIDIRNVAVGIAQGFDVDGSGVLLNGILHFLQIMHIHEGCGNAEVWQCMSQQIVAAAVDGLLCHDVAAVLGQSLNHISDGCSTGCQGQSGHAAFQSSDSLFQHILGGIGQTTVNVPCVCQTKSCCRMGAVMEYIRGSCVNRDCSCIGCRICGFLTYVEL